MVAVIIVETLIVLALVVAFFDGHYRCVSFLSKRLKRLRKERDVIYDIISEESPDSIKVSALTSYLDARKNKIP